MAGMPQMQGCNLRLTARDGGNAANAGMQFAADRHGLAGMPQISAGLNRDRGDHRLEPLDVGDQRILVNHPRPAQRRETRRDRKSTRLNSSHMSISYAVFCLKKK